MTLYGDPVPTPIHKIHHQRIRIGVGPFNWELIDGLVTLLSPDFFKPSGLSVRDTDGSFFEVSLSRARKHLESERTSVVEATLHFTNSAHMDVTVEAQYSEPEGRPPQTDLVVTGTDRTYALGLITKTEQAIQRGVIPGTDPAHLLRYDARETLGPKPRPRVPATRWRRFWDQPNAWVLQLGAVVVGGLILWRIIAWLTP